MPQGQKMFPLMLSILNFAAFFLFMKTLITDGYRKVTANIYDNARLCHTHFDLKCALGRDISIFSSGINVE